MCFFFSLIPATILVVIGYFVLYTSARADGRIGAFGRVLAVWIFVIAMFPPMAGAYVTLSGLCPIMFWPG
jgi:hypothetical protein